MNIMNSFHGQDTNYTARVNIYLLLIAHALARSVLKTLPVRYFTSTDLTLGQ